MTAFIVACAVMLAGALACVAIPLVRTTRKPQDPGDDSHRAAPTAAVALVAIPLAAWALYASVSNYPWREPSRLTQAPPQDATLDEAVASLERHLTTSPDDIDGWRLLGRAYLTTGRHEEAVGALRKAYDLGGQRDADVGLDLAEAMVLTGDGQFDARAAELVDASLAVEATNARALWYSGMIALRREDVATARARWTAMLAQNPPPNVREILVRQLIAMGATPESLGAPASSAGPPDAETRPGTQAASGRAIDVRVEIAPELATRVAPGVALFVSARQPGIPGPPLAAVRTTADRLPLAVQLSDANAMIAGRNLSSVDEVEITARISFGGTAMTTTGDLVGRALRRRDETGPLNVRIDTVAP